MLAPAPTSPPTCSTTHLLYSAACESPAPHPLSHSAVTGNVVTQQIIDSQDAFSAQRQKPEPQEGNAQGHSARKQQSGRAAGATGCAGSTLSLGRRPRPLSHFALETDRNLCLGPQEAALAPVSLLALRQNLSHVLPCPQCRNHTRVPRIALKTSLFQAFFDFV